jgi:hypothetical protein
MTQSQISQSIFKQELVLSSWRKFNHFAPAGYMLLLGGIFMYFTLRDFIIKGTVKDLLFMVVFCGACILIAIYFYQLQKKRLKLREVKADLSPEEMDLVIKKIAQELEWIPVLIDNNIIVCKTYPGFLSGSWGELITILFDGDKIFINSICDPDKQMSLISMGRNRINANRLVEELQKADRK